MWKADKKNDRDFKAWRSRNKLLRIWKTAKINKFKKRIGRFTYDLRVTNLQTSRTILDKVFPSMPKAVKFAKMIMRKGD